jgi:hypothetical protein
MGDLALAFPETVRKHSVPIRSKGATLGSFAAANIMKLLASAKQSIRFFGWDGLHDMMQFGIGGLGSINN